MNKPRVYLCSRVAQDAREGNERVAQALEAAGFQVYVPHRQAPNNPVPGERFDHEKIFRYDMDAMLYADACVVVGRTGQDCAWEMGWFFSRGLPIVHVPLGDEAWQSSPMVRGGIERKLNSPWNAHREALEAVLAKFR